jgi:hypothetical protein
MKIEARLEQCGPEHWWVEVIRAGKRQEYLCGTKQVAERFLRLFLNPQLLPGQRLQRPEEQPAPG